MDRRNFLRSILGVAAATALPSEVWPFRKIFLPAAPQVWTSEWQDLSRAVYPGPLYEAQVHALELESFAKSIPCLIYNGKSAYNFFRNAKTIEELARPRIPMRFAGGFSIVD